MDAGSTDRWTPHPSPSHGPKVRADHQLAAAHGHGQRARREGEEESEPGQVIRHELGPGTYELGTRHDTPDGTYDDIVQSDTGTTVARVRQTDLPPP